MDLGIGTTAAFAITAQWHAGEGGYLDLAMLDVARAWAEVKPEAVTSPEPTYGVLTTQDGQLVSIALLEDSMWGRLCVALGWDDWSTDPALAHYADRRTHATRIRSRLTDTVASLDLTDVLALAGRHDLPLGALDTAGDSTAYAQLSSRLPRDPLPWQRSLPLRAELLVDLDPAPVLGREGGNTTVPRGEKT